MKFHLRPYLSRKFISYEKTILDFDCAHHHVIVVIAQEKVLRLRYTDTSCEQFLGPVQDHSLCIIVYSPIPKITN